jgi:hypothetical protein
VHEIRRTVASGMAELAVRRTSSSGANHVRGHKAGVVGTLNRAEYLVRARGEAALSQSKCRPQRWLVRGQGPRFVTVLALSNAAFLLALHSISSVLGCC